MKDDLKKSEPQTELQPAAPRIEFLRELAAIVRRESLSELIVEEGGVRWTLKAASTPVAPTFAPSFAPPLREAAVAEIAPDEVVSSSESMNETANAGLIPIVAPMVGLFYRSPTPDSPPFVEVGDRVEIGQEVGIIEAMKVFNEIISEIEGTVVQILFGNGQLIETGQTLFLIRS